jgi:flavin-dependent dehydrogenase
LEGPFLSAFAPQIVRGDKVLHWLMRTALLSRTDLSSLASQGIVVIGDSAHATPILGGNGANAAIRDAVELAKVIIASRMTEIIDEGQETGIDWRSIIEAFYDRIYGRWESEADESERAIAEMHARPPGKKGANAMTVL